MSWLVLTYFTNSLLYKTHTLCKTFGICCFHEVEMKDIKTYGYKLWNRGKTTSEVFLMCTIYRPQKKQSGNLFWIFYLETNCLFCCYTSSSQAIWLVKIYSNTADYAYSHALLVAMPTLVVTRELVSHLSCFVLFFFCFFSSVFMHVHYVEALSDSAHVISAQNNNNDDNNNYKGTGWSSVWLQVFLVKMKVHTISALLWFDSD